MTTLPRVGVFRFLRVPPNSPMAVRQAETITTSFIAEPPFMSLMMTNEKTFL
jgi:hypothetical protein